MIRVGDTYFMSSTTMHLSPGLPIMKSQDLVNWQLVGYAYDTLADNEALTNRVPIRLPATRQTMPCTAPT